MNRRAFVSWGLRAALAAQLLGSDLLDMAVEAPKATYTWFVDFAGVRFYPDRLTADTPPELSSLIVEHANGWRYLEVASGQRNASMFVKRADGPEPHVAPDGTAVEASPTPYVDHAGVPHGPERHLVWQHRVQHLPGLEAYGFASGLHPTAAWGMTEIRS